MKTFTLKIGEAQKNVYPLSLLDDKGKELAEKEGKLSSVDLRNLAEIDSIIGVLEKQIPTKTLLLNRAREMYNSFIGEELAKILLQDGGRTHLSIEISEKAFELARLPWDLMHDGESYLIEKGFSLSRGIR